MTKAKLFFLTGAVLTIMIPGAAQAHKGDEGCFSYWSGSGSIKVCTGQNTVTHKEKTKKVVHHYYSKPVAFTPPGHRKHRFHHKHNGPKTYKHNRHGNKRGRW